jgi:hypothetical protein
MTNLINIWIWFSSQCLVRIYCFLPVCWMARAFNTSRFISLAISTEEYKLWFPSLCKPFQFPVAVHVFCVPAELQVSRLRVCLSTAVDQWTFVRSLTGTDQRMLNQMYRFKDMNSGTATYCQALGNLKFSTSSRHYAQGVTSITISTTLCKFFKN